MIVFSHIRNTGNTGDLASCPAQWFGFPEYRVVNYDAPVGDCTAIVYGGGTMANWMRGRALPKVARIAWGIGSSRHGERLPWPDPDDFDLVGSREWSPAREAAGRWAPCASCMSPLFNGLRSAKREAVLFINASPSIKSRYPVAVGGLPVMENAEPLERIIPFLAGAETVVTNSYHGVYWATLLGRRVVCLPYSSKFHGFRYSPAYSTDHGLDWRARAGEVRAYPDALAECRAATVAFYERVMKVIGEPA